MMINGKTPDFKKLKSQPLSMVLMSIPEESKQDSDGSKPDFVYLEKEPDPVDLIRAMWRSKSKGYATVIQPKFIKKCTVKTKKTGASGTVEFVADGLYTGKVNFTARHKDGSWEITEFLLPNSNMKIALNKNNEWKVVSLESNAK